MKYEVTVHLVYQNLFQQFMLYSKYIRFITVSLVNYSLVEHEEQISLAVYEVYSSVQQYIKVISVQQYMKYSSVQLNMRYSSSGINQFKHMKCITVEQFMDIEFYGKFSKANFPCCKASQLLSKGIVTTGLFNFNLLSVVLP